MSEVEELERKKKAIADLIEENEQMEKNAERLNFALSSQEQEYSELVKELKERISNLEL